VLTEADWNTTSSISRNPYYFSKAEAERAAWRFVQDQRPGFDLVVMNPALVLGPAHTKALNTSNKLLVDMWGGVFPAVLHFTWAVVDVRDVAAAHRLAADSPEAAGRYICVSDVWSARRLSGFMRDQGYRGKTPTLRLDNPVGNGLAWLSSFARPRGTGEYLRTNVGRTIQVDPSKVRRELGATFRAVEQTVRDSLADLERWGHIDKDRSNSRI
jgi:dihydroflavonol-4-reductase